MARVPVKVHEEEEGKIRINHKSNIECELWKATPEWEWPLFFLCLVIGNFSQFQSILGRLTAHF